MYFCPKQGQDFKPPAAPLYPNMGQVPPPGFQVRKAFDSKLSVVHGWCGSVIKWNSNVEYFPLCLKIPNKFPNVKPSYCSRCQLPEHNEKGKDFFFGLLDLNLKIKSAISSIFTEFHVISSLVHGTGGL